MEVRAHLRFLRMTPRKVRAVVDLVRGLSVDKAIDQLTILPRAASQPVLKLLNSAIANAEHNFHLQHEHLRIKLITANEGPRLKRYQPRAFGRAAEILKRTSHVTIVLEDDGKSAKPEKKAEKPAKVDTTGKVVKGTPAEPKKPATEKKAASAPATAKHAAQDKTIRRQGKT